MRKTIPLIIIGIIWVQATWCQIFDRRSPALFYMRPKQLESLKIKTLTICAYNFENADDEQECHLYKIDKAGLKMFYVVKLFKNGQLVEANNDTLLFTPEMQTGYECVAKEKSDSLVKPVCDSKGRIISRGDKNYGNYEWYEYDLQTGGIKNEYVRLERVERIPFFKRIYYEYDAFKRLTRISYYEPDSAKKIVVSPKVFDQIPFKLIYQDLIYYNGKTRSIKSIEHREDGSSWRNQYYYLKSGLPVSVKIYESESKKAMKQVGEYKFKYTFY